MSPAVNTVLLRSVDVMTAMLGHLQRTGVEGEFDLDEILGELAAHTPAADAQPPVTAPAPRSNGRAPDVASIGADEAAAVPGAEETRIHVDVGLLDHLMNLTGELVLARNRVLQCAGADALEPVVARDVVQQLNGLVSDFQVLMLKTRMQAMRRVFGLLPRLVQDLARASGKDIALRLDGQDTELDRTLLEAIKDPVLHIVRNAVDHGIERPDVRRQKGKPPQGVIALRAYHEGGYVHIDATNDGAEIDRERIKAKALAEGLITAEKAQTMSDREILHLIFRPGFSTSATVTSISGRGVGMDVVKQNLDRIGGIIDLHTEPGKGTTIRIRIPITLAIIAGADRHGVGPAVCHSAGEPGRTGDAASR
jgi:two-component system, chemotaxis family, sensor kinase CheA